MSYHAQEPAYFTDRQEAVRGEAMTWSISRNAVAVLAKLNWYIAAFAFTCDDQYLACKEAMDIELELGVVRDEAMHCLYDYFDVCVADNIFDSAIHVDGLVMEYTEAKLKEMVL